MERIQRRGRAIESGITAEYLALLDSFYEEWMQTFDLCPILTIRTEDLDFVNKPHHLDIVMERIQQKLAGREDVVFA
jgi:deoxyadenosine/deoxycytidine kinase